MLDLFEQLGFQGSKLVIIGSYLCGKQLNKYEENIWWTTWILSQTNDVFNLEMQTSCTSPSLIELKTNVSPFSL